MLAPTTNQGQLKLFLGMINFYRKLWPKQSHILAPLSKLAGTKSKKVWKQKETEQTAFTEAKTMLKKETMLAFPDFTKPLHVYTGTSDRQLGVTIVQNGRRKRTTGN